MAGSHGELGKHFLSALLIPQLRLRTEAETRSLCQMSSGLGGSALPAFPVCPMAVVDLAMGQNPVPPANISIPTKIKPKLGGAPTPKWDPIGVDAWAFTICWSSPCLSPLEKKKHIASSDRFPLEPTGTTKRILNPGCGEWNPLL